MNDTQDNRVSPNARTTEQSLASVLTLAEEWSVHPNTIRNLVYSGQLRAVRIGRRVRFRREDINAYLERGAP